MTQPDREDIQGLKQSVETILQALHNSGLMGRFERESSPLRGTPREARAEGLGVGERLGDVSEIAVDETHDRDLYTDGEEEELSGGTTGARPKRASRRKKSNSRSPHGSPPPARDSEQDSAQGRGRKSA